MDNKVKGVYKAGRMTSGGKVESDDTKPKGESQGKYDARKQAQLEGRRMYEYKGKTEYAGKQDDMGSMESRSPVEVSRSSVSINIPDKTPEVKQAPVSSKKVVGKVKAKPATTARERAPGLGGSNTLQQKF